MDGYLNYRVLNLVNSYRQLHKGFEPYLDDSGNIKSEFTTDKYKDSLTHNDDDLVSDEEEEDTISPKGKLKWTTPSPSVIYSTVTLFARLRGMSTSHPRRTAR
jgi:hypothetical protein